MLRAFDIPRPSIIFFLVRDAATSSSAHDPSRMLDFTFDGSRKRLPGVWLFGKWTCT